MYDYLKWSEYAKTLNSTFHSQSLWFRILQLNVD